MSRAEFLSDRYFSVHLTTNIGHVKLSTNVVYGRNGLRGAMRAYLGRGGEGMLVRKSFYNYSCKHFISGKPMVNSPELFTRHLRHRHI